MEVLLLGNTNVCIVSAYLQKIKTFKFLCGNEAHIEWTSPNSPRLDEWNLLYTHKESGLVWWKFLECRKEIQTSGVIRQADYSSNLIKFGFNYYYYEILKKINFTLWSYSLSHLTPGTELDSKISYLKFFYFNQKMNEVHLEGQNKNEWLGS